MPAKRLLVPVDFSGAAHTAALLAATAANRSGGELVLAHVDAIPGATLLSVEPIVVPPAVWERIAGDARGASSKKLEEWAAEISGRAPNAKVSSRELSGSTVATILDMAADFDLIVMGSHGASGAERLFFGSVAESVSREAPCPVLVTRERDDVSSVFERVVVGVDLGGRSLDLARLAATFVADGGVLELVHVMGVPRFDVVAAAMTGSSPEWQQALEKGREGAVAAISELASQLDSSRYTIRSNVEVGRVEDELLGFAKGAGLVVVGAHAREDIRERILGTTADRVLRHSEIPVLLVPVSA